MRYAASLLAVLLLLLGIVPRLAAQSTAFAYRGQISDGGQPANGYYELQFRLADAATGGNYVGPTLELAPRWVSNGLFTVALDFGATVFDGSARWMEIGVRTNGGTSYTVLSPRQEIQATPYAIFSGSAATAASVSGPVAASQLTGVLAAGQLPSFVLTNGASGANLSGTFTGTVISPSVAGNGAGLTNVPVAAANMDNATWLGWIAGRFGSYSNINRYATSNTFYALRNQQPLTVLFEGNGWVNAGGVGAVFDVELENLTNIFGVRGFIGNPYAVYGTGNMYCPISVPDWQCINQPGGAWCGGRTTNWWPGYLYTSNLNDGFYYGCSLTQPMDTYELDWVSTPYGGRFSVATNNGSGWHVLTTLNGYSSQAAGNAFKWTNATATANMLIAITNTAVGTNNFVTFGFFNSQSSGVVFVQQGLQGTSPAEQNAVPAPVRAPIYRSWNPTLILYLMGLNVGNSPYSPVNTSDSVAIYNFYATNTPHADVVLCSQFAITGVGLPFNVDDPYWKMQFARTDGWPYFDGIQMCGDYNDLLRRGIADGNSHLTAAGYQFYGNLLWNWLGLMERR